jgi:hypothetical protein
LIYSGRFGPGSHVCSERACFVVAPEGLLILVVLRGFNHEVCPPLYFTGSLLE